MDDIFDDLFGNIFRGGQNAGAADFTAEALAADFAAPVSEAARALTGGAPMAAAIP